MTTAQVVLLGFLAVSGDDSFPLALHRTMELDDQEREIRRQHDLVLTRQAQVQNSRRLAEKGLISRDQMERERTELKFQEAREEELRAYRDLKAHERDVLQGATPADTVQSQTLLLNLLRKQEAMARVEMEYRAFRLKQEQSLLERGATSRFQRDLAALEYEAARGNVEIGVARQAQVEMEIAARSGKGPDDPGEFLLKKLDYIRARIRYSEVRVATIRRRLELALQIQRAGLTTDAEVDALKAMLRSAMEDLEAERKLLVDPKAPLPAGATRFMT